MAHCCAPFLGDNTQYTGRPLYAFSVRGQLGVMLFFIISGYCITAASFAALVSNKPIWRYAYERARRIYPPYLAALIFGLCTTLAIGYANSHHWIGPVHHLEGLSTSPRYWIANLLLIQTELNTGTVNIVFWSLCFEVAFYLITGVWLWIAQKMASHHGRAFGTRVLILGFVGTTYASLLSLIFFDHAVFPFNMWHQFALGGILFFFLESSLNTLIGISPRLQHLMKGLAAVAVLLTLVCIALHPGRNSI